MKLHHLLKSIFHRFFSSKPALGRHSYAKVGHRSLTRQFDAIRTVFRNGEYHLSAVQLKALVEAAGTPRDRSILQLFGDTGIRRSELVAIDISDIDRLQSMILVRHGKGDKLRLLPLTPSMIRQLMTLSGDRSSGPVFVSSRGNRLSVRQLNRIVAAAGVRAGLTNPNPRHRLITCHLLRHSFSRLWKAHGGSIETLSKILGHASIKTTMDVYGTESLTDVQRNYRLTMRAITRRR